MSGGHVLNLTNILKGIETQLSGKLTSWLFTKRGRGFEQATTPKQIHVSGQRGNSNHCGLQITNSAPLTTRPRRLPEITGLLFGRIYHVKGAVSWEISRVLAKFTKLNFGHCVN